MRDYHRLLGEQGQPSCYGIEAYAMAKVLLDAVRKSGTNLIRGKLVTSLEELQDHGLGDYRVSYLATERFESRFVDLTVTGSGGLVLR